MKSLSNKNTSTMVSKHKGYCTDCHFTIWIGERITFDGRAHHLDCKRAIKDETPRDLHPHWQKLFGKPNIKKLKNKVESM